MTFAGIPTAVAPAGISRVTTAFAPIRAPVPTVMSPRTFAPIPIRTPSEIVGCRLTFSSEDATQGDAVVHQDIVADDGCLADHDAHAVGR